MNIPNAERAIVEAAKVRDYLLSSTHPVGRFKAPLVFNDLLWTPPHSGWSQPFYRLLRQGPQVPLLAKRMFASDAQALRTWLLRLAQTGRLIRLVPGHGAPIERNASEVLLQVAAGV